MTHQEIRDLIYDVVVLGTPPRRYQAAGLGALGGPREGSMANTNSVKKLSHAQRKFLKACNLHSEHRRPSAIGPATGRLARAWDRTAESLERLGMIEVFRGAGTGSGAYAVLVDDGAVGHSADMLAPVG